MYCRILEHVPGNFARRSRVNERKPSAGRLIAAGISIAGAFAHCQVGLGTFYRAPAKRGSRSNLYRPMSGTSAVSILTSAMCTSAIRATVRVKPISFGKVRYQQVSAESAREGEIEWAIVSIGTLPAND